MVETEASTVATPCIEDWTDAPWRKLEQHVFRLQKRIYKAQSRGNIKAVHSLQRLLVKSQAARMLAVRRVTQDNQGKRTAGVDGVKAVGPMTRLLFVERLRAQHRITAHPVRRIMIPKPGKDERRPLGIPVMLDRAHQALAKLALEPQWEARFEPNSYGFRPGRSCHDAIEAIYLAVSKQNYYVLDADIQGCFDHIDHHALLTKLDTTPTLYRACKAWLRAGVMDGGTIVPTTSGTPQGGVISPLLANIALHGMEEAAAQAYKWYDGHKTHRPLLIRYADDFVIIHRHRAGIEAARDAIEAWLGGMGLHLSPAKTRITHTLHDHEGTAGFDFLGFTIRQYARGKTRSNKGRNGQPLGYTTRTTPSKEAVKRHMESIGDTIRRNNTAPQSAVIRVLNPIIGGWAHYYRTCAASEQFNRCDAQLYSQLQSWARRRHHMKSKTWIAHRYWSMRPGAKWDFVIKKDGKPVYRLWEHGDIHIQRHIKVRGNATPYDGNLRYWAQRLKDHPLTRGPLGRLLTKQQGRCAYCGLTFKDGDLLEIDHIHPTSLGGSKRDPQNQQVLHRHCHDQKTATDGSLSGTRDKGRPTEEPDEVKTSRPVL